MSSPLPPEILDLIVDFLHDEPDALKACCLVSKSWVHRTRKHLFAHIGFSWESQIQPWKKTFPDPSNSPARYTRSLLITMSPVVTSVDMRMDGWIRAFSGIVRLFVNNLGDKPVSLVPLHGLSPTLKSLRLACGSSTPSSEIFGLVCSFPLLEDLALTTFDRDGEVDRWDIPSTSPKFTGYLNLRTVGGIGPVVHRLLELPSGLHFSKISVSCLNEDVESMIGLVSKCSNTLESLSVYYYLVATNSSPPLDLSKLTKLKEVVFGCSGPSVQRIAMALRTAQSINLERITIRWSPAFGTSIAEREWQDLDRVLLQFWTSHSIRPEIGYDGGNFRELAPRLLPELTSRGVVGLVEWSLDCWSDD